MIANYGYMDGSGEFYITIDTDKCIDCEDHSCIAACPKDMFDVEPDDYDEDAAFIKNDLRQQIKYLCAECKPVSDRPPLPCVTACKDGAISHSW